MSNSVNLSLDVTKTGIQNPLIKVRQGDGGFETLRTTVTANGEPMDLQGWTITFMGTTAGNHKIVDDNVTVVEAPNGIFDYTPSKTWGMDIGEFKIAYFKFVNGDGSASSANFRVNVIEAVDLTQEEAQNYISVVDTTIAEINQHLTDSLASVTQSIADANANANTVASNVNTLGNRVDNYNSKLASIKVGGRNLLVGSKNFDGNGWNIIGGNIDQSYFQGLASVSAAGAWNGPKYKNSVLENQGKIIDTNTQYILSAWVNNTGTSAVDIYLYSPGEINNDGQIVAVLPPKSGWVRIASNPFKFNKTTGLSSTLRFEGSSNIQGGVLKQAGLQLEIGNVPTDWKPAPEDVPINDAQLVHKTGTETIAGDKTFTSPINGNAATATKWQTARTLALTGDVSGSVSMDGSGNVSMVTTGDNLVHKTGSETIAGDKTFTGQLNTSALKIAGDDYTNTASATANYLGATISFVRIGKLVTFTSGVSTFTSDVPSGLTSNIIPNGFKPALQQNIRSSNQSVASNFFSFDQGGGIYSYGTYASGAQPRISGTYITTEKFPV